MKKSKKIVSSLEDFVLGKFYLIPNLDEHRIEDYQNKKLIDLEKVNNFILTKIDIHNSGRVDLEFVPLVFGKKAEKKGNYSVLLCSKNNAKVLPSVTISIKNVQKENFSQFMMPCKCEINTKCLNEEDYQSIVNWQNERRERNGLKITNISFLKDVNWDSDIINLEEEKSESSQFTTNNYQEKQQLELRIQESKEWFKKYIELLKSKFNECLKDEKEITKKEIYLELILDSNEQIIENGENSFAQQQINKRLNEFSISDKLQINFLLEQQRKIFELEREFEKNVESELIANIESSQTW